MADRLRAGSTLSAGRRKWSDWSECTENCIRTRHRLNCDDLTRPREADVNLSSTRREATSKPAARRVQRSSGQDEDPDYADEGDGDDEDDSCANVEPSKTFEEQICFGGQCKSLPDELPRPIGGGAQLAHQSKGGQQRSRSKGLSNGYAAPARPGGTQKSSPDPSPAQNNQRTSVAANRTAAYIHKHSDNADPRRGIELVQAADGLGAIEPPWPSRSMWPPSTNATLDQQRGRLAPPTVSLQPALLLAAAIFSLVLVAALLIGRLFARTIEPQSKLTGHNWMRAAQKRQRRRLRRRESPGKLDVSSGSSPSSSCRLQLDQPACQQALLTPRSMEYRAGRPSCPSSYTDPHQPILIGQRLGQMSQQQQFCYFWERKGHSLKDNPPPLSFASSLSHLAQQLGPGKAQKLDGYQRGAEQAAGFFANHRTGQHRQAIQSQAGLCSTSSTCSSSSGSARRVTAKLISHHQSQSHAQLGNSFPICHFDSQYAEPNAMANAPLTSDQDYADYDTLDQCNMMAASSSKQPPKVPRATSGDAPAKSQLPTQTPTPTSSSSSSLSVMSATAQLVSNGAHGGGNSSSLDQAPEIVDILQESEGMAASSSQREAASAPAKRRQYHMSAGNRPGHSHANAPDGRATGDIDGGGGGGNSGEQQQHFYEEIGRME